MVFASEIRWSDILNEAGWNWNNQAKMTKMREIIEASWGKDCRQIYARASLENIQEVVENGNCDWSIYHRQSSLV